MRFRNKKYEALRAAYNILEAEHYSLEDEVKRLKRNILTIDEAKKRDYIIRTDYIGKIKDEGLLEDFKQEIEQQLNNNFESCCRDLLNYNLIELYKFREILNLYEMKQIILDTYAKKTPKTKQQWGGSMGLITYKTCHCCGETFPISDVKGYNWKMSEGDKVQNYYCSYKCYSKVFDTKFKASRVNIRVSKPSSMPIELVRAINSSRRR